MIVSQHVFISPKSDYYFLLRELVLSHLANDELPPEIREVFYFIKLKGMLNLLKSFYTSLYNKGEKSDSPDFTRVEMQRKVISALLQLEQRKFQVLNIGSGPQVLERQMIAQLIQLNYPLTSGQFCTVDIADIPPRKLLALKRGVDHYYADANNLTEYFGDYTFDIVISNLAIDFAGLGAMHEAHRILTQNGRAFFHFHHPAMLENMNDINEPQVCAYWSYLRDNQILFSSAEEINLRLSNIGFVPTLIKERVQFDRKDNCNHYWWEVEATKY